MQRRKTRIGWLLAAMVLAAIPRAAVGGGTTDTDRGAEEDPARALVQPPPGFIEACQRYGWLCEARPGAASTLSSGEVLELARRINRQVNMAVTHISDSENYGRADYWTLPNWRGGDCEDFVLEKYKRLLDAGVDGRDLSIAVVRSPRQENHAVLVLHHKTGDLVLDSLKGRILLWNESDYRYLAMQTRDDQSAWEVVAHQPKDSVVLAQR